MEKIEFYQRSAVMEIIENILSTFYLILAMNVIEYVDLVVCLKK